MLEVIQIYLLFQDAVCSEKPDRTTTSVRPHVGVENADNRRQNEPVTDNANVEERINELNELLAHVLDEISSLKSAIYYKNQGCLIYY